ncbi:hypothetical protein [Nocardia sp. NPDC057440]|uniref:hypothetical protein n=1 Tax=Nocardia sp. NPDC057440 TaxID=3346134 RepID=UPI00366CE61B
MSSDSAVFYAEFDPYNPEAISIKARVTITGFNQTVEVKSLPMDFFAPGSDSPYEPGDPLTIDDLDHILWKDGWKHGDATWYDEDKDSTLDQGDSIGEGNVSVRVTPSHWSGPLVVPNEFLANLFTALNQLR